MDRRMAQCRDLFVSAWLIVVMLAVSVLGMMVVHEFGHVLGAWLAGVKVTKVVLHPLKLSRTDVAVWPRPAMVVWGGFVWGCGFPLVAFGIVKLLRWLGVYLLRFFAGMCLVINGAYLGAGWLGGQTNDSIELVDSGVPRLLLTALGAVMLGAGLWLWHGQGRHFGLGVNRKPTELRVALGVTGVLILLIAVELLLSS